MAFSIDGNNVNDRTDWKRQYLPSGLLSHNAQGFPGDSDVYETKGPKLPGRFAVRGYIVGATADDLDQAYVSAEAWRESGPVTVVVNGVTYQDCSLQSLEPQGEIHRRGGMLAQQVVFVWRKLK